MLVASTPETTNPVATQCEIEEVPCISTVAPWQPYFIGRQANPGGGPPAWKPFNYTYHFFWGLEDVIAVFTNMWGQLQTNKSVGGLFPNDGDGNAWGDKRVGFPPVLDKLGYKLTDPGRYQNLTDDFSRADRGVQESELRDHHRRGAAARFHHVLESGAAARPQAEGRLDRQGDPVPGRRRSAGQERQQPVVGSVVVAEPSVQVVADRTIGQGHRRRLTKSRPASNGRSRSASSMRCSSSPSTCAKRSGDVGDNKGMVKAIAATKLDTVVGPIAWDGKNLPPFAAKNIAKTPLVGGQWRLRDGGKYDIVITDNKTAPEIPVGGKMEPIA